MKQFGHLKTYNMKLTTLAPIFIGGGEFNDLSQLQYVLTDGKLKIIDEAKFMKFLKNGKLFDNFIDYVSKPQYNKKGKQISPTLSYWINQNFPNKQLDIYSAIKEVGYVATRNLNCVKSFIKNKNGNPYIPGSSIKGAISTALLAYFSRQNKETAESVLKEQMSHIQIADTKPISKEAFIYRQTAHQQLISDEKSCKKNGELRVDYNFMNVDNNLKEILKEGIALKFMITIDDKFQFTIHELLDILNDFYSEILEENNVLDEIGNDLKTNINVPDCKPNINIGGQSGFNTKVILKAITEDDYKYQARKKEILDRAFRKHHHLQSEIAPRCLKVVKRSKENTKTQMPFGWCNISIAE